MKRIILCLAFALFSSVIVLPLFSAEDPRMIFDKAIALKENAKDEEAQLLFVQAADLFESLSASDWHHWYEAGNSFWWAARPDRAVLDYRRYLSHDPFRGEVWENLAQARQAAGTRAPGHEGFLFWPWFLWLASAAAFCIGLSVLFFSLHLFFRARSWRKAAVVLFFIAFFLSLGASVSFAARGKIGVVITSTQGRKGDASVYAPWPADMWKAGQEAWITGQKDTWTRILVGDTVSWIPSDSILINK